MNQDMAVNMAIKNATNADVAKRMGVDPGELPEGLAEVQTVRNGYLDHYTCYTWRDEAGKKKYEVKVSDNEHSTLNYTESTFNQKGVVNYTVKRHQNGSLSHFHYHDNGTLAHADHATELNLEPARFHEFFDTEGKLHNLDGFASYYTTKDGTFDAKYMIHGNEYTKSGYNKNPERIAFKQENGWLTKLGRSVAGWFSVSNEQESPSTNDPTSVVDTLIAAAQSLSSEDKLRLIESLSSRFNDAAITTGTCPKAPARIVKGPASYIDLKAIETPKAPAPIVKGPAPWRSKQ